LSKKSRFQPLRWGYFVPILHTQLQIQGRTPDGKAIAFPPQFALSARGPVLQVSVTVEQTVAKNLVQRGIPIPSPITGWGLIDTGASITCIDEEAAQKLQLPAVDVVTMASASQASSQRSVYPIQIEVIGFPIRLQALRAVGAALKAQDLLLLIGRDVLQMCTLFYNGISGEITLSI
jgi:predicted aspartyl protease